jgi:hypothetical protein
MQERETTEMLAAEAGHRAMRAAPALAANNALLRNL